MATLDGEVLGAVLRGPRSGNWYESGAPVLHSLPGDAVGELLSSDGPSIERGGGAAIGGLLAGGIASNWWNGELSEAARYIGRHVPTEVQGVDLDGTNYWTAVPANARLPGATISPRINWTSADREMLGVSVPGRFIKMFDGGAVVGEAYHLTQHKPWQAHEDRVALEAETYDLTIISGWPSTPPRHVSMVRHPEGALVEWDPPADRGSAPIQEYRLYRGLSAGSMELIASPGGDARHHFDADAPAGSIYKLYAFNGVLESDPTFALEIIDPDTDRISMRDAITGEAWAGLPYAGWLGVRAIRLAPSTITILPSGRELQIEAVIYPVDATVLELVWSSSRPDIVSVDQDGIVTAHAPGRAVITAMATDGTEISAQVPIVSMPRLMVDDIADRLLELGFAQVFKRFSPDLPDKCIVLRQLAGEAPEAALPIDRPALAVAVRSRDLGEASALLKELHDALHMCTPTSINGTHYYAIEALSSGQYEDKDRRGPRYVCTTTFRIEKERRLGGSP